ncbi:hypothetical protein NL676_019601 [Syzygium grande]|nr:hypothetical protein NL676_019601 [Syzygium grande]
MRSLPRRQRRLVARHGEPRHCRASALPDRLAVDSPRDIGRLSGLKTLLGGEADGRDRTPSRTFGVGGRKRRHAFRMVAVKCRTHGLPPHVSWQNETVDGPVVNGKLEKFLRLGWTGEHLVEEEEEF